MNKPYKSTTHHERFYHFNTPGEPRGTVFMRREFSIKECAEWFGTERPVEALGSDTWYGTAAVCSDNDVFNKRLGRTIARRRFFVNPHQCFECEPSYEGAKRLLLTYARLFGKVPYDNG